MRRYPSSARRDIVNPPLHPLPRHTCRGCAVHPARFRYRGEVRADRDHELCFRCFRAMLDRLRAKALREAA